MRRSTADREGLPVSVLSTLSVMMTEVPRASPIKAEFLNRQEASARIEA